VTFLQNFSQHGRKKVQRVSISPDKLRASFLQYIMGRMPETERSGFEEQLLGNQEFSDTAAACENDLIDDYALHRLDPDAAQSIRLWIEASPQRVQRVAIARALLTTTRRRSRYTQTSQHRARQIGAVLAAAACLLIAAAAYRIHTRTRSEQLSAANTPPPVPAAINQPQSATPDIVLLSAERTRGRQAITTYKIHRASSLELQIVLPGETARSSYHVQIRRFADPQKIMLQKDALEAQILAGQLYLTLTAPPNSLPPATYIASVIRQNETLVSVFTLQWSVE
jgi:anti-sigma-K factor RskA